MKRPVLIAIATMALIFGGLWLWKHGHEILATETLPPASPTPVAATIAHAGAARASLEAIGTLVAIRQVALAPEIAGRITTIHFTAGTRVERGQPLLQLYDEPERAQLANLQAKMAFAKSQLTRSQALAPSGAEPRNMLEQHQFNFAAASADARRVNAIIAQKQIRAPFSGEVGIRQVNLGQYLNAGDTIATLSDLDSLFANFTLPQKYLGQLHTGQAVHVLTDAFPGHVFPAKVTAIEAQVADLTRNVTIQATLSNAAHLLRPGMYAQITLELPPQPDVLTVPDTSVQTSQDGETVMVVERPDRHGVGKVRVQPVRTSTSHDGRTEIVDGLHAGDVVVTAGQVRLEPGAMAKVLLEPAAAQERTK